MDAKHTPGPWRAKGPDVFDAEDGLVVSLTNSWKRDKVSRERDRYDPVLIAAAPDLLAACQGMVELLSGKPMSGIEAEQRLQAALSAIAKASPTSETSS